MELYHIILAAAVFLVFFTGLGWSILSLIYLWLKLKIQELKEGVFTK